MARNACIHYPPRGCLSSSLLQECVQSAVLDSLLGSGMLVQCLTTSITCLAFTLTRSWALTLVVLSAVPVLIFIQGLSQSITGPLLAQEHVHTANAATLVDRAIASIATVKAFNAVPHELSS